MTTSTTYGDLHALRFGDGDRHVLAVHGITASAMSWPAVAAALGPDWTMTALDLRGRGRSRDAGPPYGLRAHAADVRGAARRLAQETGAPPVLVGHSMGAYVAVIAVDEEPELFSRVVLVDGGVPLPLPEGADPDEVLAATLGPALERLQVTYGSTEEYVDFFRRHPALAEHWSPVVEDYVRYDALPVDAATPEPTPAPEPTSVPEPVEGPVRSRAVDEAVRADGRDLLVAHAELDAGLRGLRLPAHLLTAPSGMFGQPPGLLPAEAVAAYGAEVDALTTETVPDCNHYTILFDPAAAARVAAAVAG